ncbi:MAG: aa3-type cytochrome c oxidase subunit IV [Xanthobacteraceae bacterium]
MAEHGDTTYDTASGNDYAAHEAAYRSFVNLAKYGTGTAIVVLVLMALFLV